MTRLGERVAIVGADDAFHTALRARYGMRPGGSARAPDSDLAYLGHDFRAYDYFSIAEASRFYAALERRWDAGVLARYLAIAGLEPRFEIKRMKRAYQRALVLCFALASSPERLVVELGEEFDEPPTRALLERATESVSHALVTFASADGDLAWFDDVVPAASAL